MPAATVFETISDPWRPRDEAWLARSPSQYAGQTDRPVLLGACPRSGTTLLRGLINNHWDIAMPGESNFVFHVWRHRAEFGSMRREVNRRRLGEWIFDSEGRGAKRIQGSSTRDEAVEWVATAAPTIGSALAAPFELYAHRHKALRWGDKRPGYAGFIAAMFALFPNAQFINLVRDPRGAAASQVPLGWDDPADALASGVATWEASIQRVDDFARTLRPDQLLDVRFEDLVRDPHGELRRIFAFLDVRRGDPLIAGVIKRKRRGEFREGWHDRLNEDIDTAPIDSWRKRLSPEDTAFVEHVTRPYLERFGYVALPGLDAAFDPSELERLEHQRWRRETKWQRRAKEERRNRIRTLWAPVAARPRRRAS